MNIFDEFHKWYYNTGLWQTVTYLGVPCEKLIFDLWNYQEIITELKPDIIIEFGTLRGGSTLFFSDILNKINPNGLIITVDIDISNIYESIKNRSNIKIIEGDTSSNYIKNLLLEYNNNKKFIILDSLHIKEHVLKELKLLRDISHTNDYLIVEDTNIKGHPVVPTDEWDGPMEALLEYEKEYPNDYSHDFKRESKFGITFAPYGYLIRR